MKRLYHIRYLALLAFFVGLMGVMQSCVSYSFTGASIPPEAKTISIQYFENKADFIVPSLSAALTNAVEDKFTGQTDLALVENEGDLKIEGYISNYTITPQAITGNETAALTRLTISVKVKYENTIETNKDYESTFTRYEEFDSGSDISSVQEALIESIVEMIAEDIFNKAVVNW
ncbi:MAG: hypothetical protein CSB02_01035 [Bacteroidia bacterium]|nr:MAG: hypothetical protein CSB02_01035 [Bacteroidia bacterium]